MNYSEAQANAHLNLTRYVALPVGAQQRAEISVGRIQHRIAAKNRMVEEVHGFGAKLDQVIFFDRGVLREGHVEFRTPAVAQVSEILRRSTQREGRLDSEDRLLARTYVPHRAVGVDQ